MVSKAADRLGLECNGGIISYAKICMAINPWAGLEGLISRQDITHEYLAGVVVASLSCQGAFECLAKSGVLVQNGDNSALLHTKNFAPTSFQVFNHHTDTK